MYECNGRVCAQSFATDLRHLTRDHQRMKCYALGLGLDTFRMVALTENFRKLEVLVLLNAFRLCAPAIPCTASPHHKIIKVYSQLSF